MTASARSRPTGPSTPALIRGAGLCAALGIGLSITDYADLGKWITVAGVLLLIYGLHRYGRSGADAPILFELAPAPKRKKKKKKPAASSETPHEDTSDLEAPSEQAAGSADEDPGPDGAGHDDER